MVKNYLFYIALACSLSVFSQIPSNYYSSATGSGYTLKTQLKNIIDDTNNGLTPEYESIELTYGELYNTYELSDVDIYYDHSDINLKYILDMYSEQPLAADSYEYVYGSSQQDNGSGGTAEGEKFNREHTIPQSVFNSNFPERSDAHFVIPSDKYVNAQRGNLPYGETNNNNPSENYTNGSKRGLNTNTGYTSGYTGDVFEPIDEFKGDIARMYFYFVTRYQDDLTSYNSYPMFDGSSQQALAQPFLDILYNWHIQDPVSQRELDRNNAIFTQHNNRNPFIDNPSYVSDIWSSALSISDFKRSNDDISIYPNPTSGHLISIKTSSNLDVDIYNVLGQNILKQRVTPEQNKINIQNLKSGVYILKMTSQAGSTTKKLIKN
jgi:endonuclease I